MVWDLLITAHFLCITSMGLSKEFYLKSDAFCHTL